MKLFIRLIVFSFLIFPSISFAISAQCISSDYTIATINGVFTDDNGAKQNMRALEDKVGEVYEGHTINYQFLSNPPHIGGVGDILKSIDQGLFDSETVEDYDLVEMLNSASEKFHTQKVLLVGHSQGNFYANSFYDVVAGKVGGIPTQSIGIYSVATPSGRVAGGGKWITSDTDKVIAGIVGNVPFRKIKAPNTHISLQSEDDFLGHNFSSIYIKYRSAEIVSDIQNSLDKLSVDKSRSEDVRCLEPQEINLAHKVNGAVLGAVDTLANGVFETGKFAYVSVKTGAKIAYIFSESVVATITKAAENLGAKIYDLARRTPATIGDFEISNTASVILSTADNKPLVAILEKPKVSELEQNKTQSPISVTPSPALKTKTESPSRTLTPPTTPRLVFVGTPGISPGFGGGIPLIPEPEEDQLAKSEQEIAQSPALSVPVIQVSECESSLVAEGCLVATTTIHFYWSAIEGASYYFVDKNGEYSTSTESAMEITVPDFSDYNFSVSVVNSSGQKSATSTKLISVATIPIAINEIAWMGTGASSNDEWLELKNNTGYKIDLSQWALESKDGTPYIKLSGAIEPRKFVLLERTSDETVSDVTASIIYTGALNNSGEQLVLYYASTTLDSTPPDAWVAGLNTSPTTRKTMERVLPKESGELPTNWKTWGSVIDFIKNGNDALGDDISGTPGARNSVNFISLNDGKDIEENMTLPADTGYYASSTILISASSTLTIEEGVDISFYLGEILVEGGFTAKGTSENPVTFDTFSGAQTSNGIMFDNSVGTSTLDYVRVENIGGIDLENSEIEIKNSNFVNNSSGVALYNNSVAIIENTNFASTTNEALVAEDQSVLSIASSTIINTLDAEAIAVYDSYLTVSSTTIENIYDGDGIGAYDSSISVSNSTIKNIYDGDGLGLYDSSSSIKNVAVENGSGDGIAIYGGEATIEDSSISGFTEGAGIYVSDPLAPVVILNTDTSGNGSSVEADPVESVTISP